jgi:hypothetical protein
MLKTGSAHARELALEELHDYDDDDRTAEKS